MSGDSVAHSEYWYEYDRNDPNREKPVGISSDFEVKADGYSTSIDDGMRPWGHSDFEFLIANPNITDTIDDSPKISWKYNEDKILKELESYLSSTYNQHYVDDQDHKSEQTLDKIKKNRREGFFAGNVIKYIDRYDIKGTPRQDLFKVLHYTMLLINHLDLIENNKNYETFS
jgi:hypothetical protein